MKALIDLDPIVYQYADMKYPDGRHVPAYVTSMYAENKIKQIVSDAGADTWVGYLTFGPDNFRLSIATIKPYKGNRIGKEKPYHYDYLRGYLSDLSNVRMVFGMEADDALSIEQTKAEEGTTIICTLDKDLDMVPGWHYRWSKGLVEEIKPWFQTTVDGLRCFYKQLLTGDSVDNIHGLFGVGPKSAYISALDEMDNEEAFVNHVRGLYRKWYGNYGDKFMSENGKLLWMKRSLLDDWEIPIYGEV